MNLQRMNLQRRRVVLASTALFLPRHAAAETGLRSFELDSLSQIDAGTRPYVLTFWGLNCAPCAQVLRELSRWQTRLRVVTVALDSIEESAALQHELARAQLKSEAWVFGSASPEALRYAVDPRWSGEKPRSYLVDRKGNRRALSGLLKPDDLKALI